MRASNDRILTTHVGSLPRSAELSELLLAKDHEKEYDRERLRKLVQRDVSAIVARQIDTGIDIISDGETSKVAYSTYIHDRLAGFSEDTERRLPLDVVPFPEFRARMVKLTGKQEFRRLACMGAVHVKDMEPLQTDLENFHMALQGQSYTEAFLNAASPGLVTSFQPNRFYKDRFAYIDAVAEAMQVEYEQIHAAGFLLQLDCPDLAMSRHTGFQELDEKTFLLQIEHQVEVLNHALVNIPASCLRMHVCWGNYEGPHNHDIELHKIIKVVLRAKPQAILFESSNPRHAHEWKVWTETDIPDDKILVPGVIDTTSNFVEHPELVAQRIEQFASIVGRERVIAGTDCGFGTFAGHGKMDPDISFLKLASLVEGARIASTRLWR